MKTMGVWKSIDVRTISMGLYSFWYRKYRYMVWNPLSRVWFGFGNSQPHFLLGLS